VRDPITLRVNLVLQSPMLSLPDSPLTRRRANSIIVDKRQHKPRTSLTSTTLDARGLTSNTIGSRGLISNNIGSRGQGVDNPLPFADDSQAVTPSSIDGPNLVFDFNHPDFDESSHFKRYFICQLFFSLPFNSSTNFSLRDMSFMESLQLLH